MRIESNGDISFYEDTGTTPKFFWDASAEKLGIGTATPDKPLHIYSSENALLRLESTDASTYIQLNDSNSVGAGYIGYTTDDMEFWTNNVERMRIDSSGRVGIGTTSPQERVTISTTGTSQDAVLQLLGTNSNGGQSNGVKLRAVGAASGTGAGTLAFDIRRASLAYEEAMRIDSSGNVGIGTSSPALPLQVIGNANISSSAAIGTAFLGTNPTGGAFTFTEPDSQTISKVVQIGNESAGSNDVSELRLIGYAANADSGGGLIRFFNSRWAADTALIKGVRSGTNGGALKIYTKADSGAVAERMRIDASGNVGLGSNAIASYSNYKTLTIDHDTTGSILQLNGATSGHYHLVQNNNGAMLLSADAGNAVGSTAMIFQVDGSERARIASTGRVGIGNDTSTATERFQVTTANDLNGQGYAIITLTSGTGTINHFRMVNGNGVVGSITTNASTTSFNTSSDYRLKDVDGPITNSGAYIDALKPVQGSWKADGSRFIGLIAHEVQEVSETPIATGEKDGEEMQAMDYSAPELIANLIAEIQSLRARMAQLEGA